MKITEKQVQKEFLCKVCGLRYLEGYDNEKFHPKTEHEFVVDENFPHGQYVSIGSKNMRIVKDEDL